jgi:protein-S-isoprenylcysteine O-methyltransferase Ste14
MSLLEQNRTTGSIQSTRKGILLAAVLCGIVFLIVGDSHWSNEHILHETIEWLGIGLIVLCIVGRTWCTLYIGGHKNDVLIADGPYSISRNPLYLFSILGAIGVGAQLGSVMMAVTSGFIAWIVFLRMAMAEEARLVEAFGEAYRHYLDRVPRLLPRFPLWQDRALLQVQPKLVVTTFFDALIFLLAIPIAEGFEYLHEIGILPTYFTVP